MIAIGKIYEAHFDLLSIYDSLHKKEEINDASINEYFIYLALT